MSYTAKRDELRTLVETTLTDFRVDARIRKGMFSEDIADRRAFMGNPIRYASVLPEASDLILDDDRMSMGDVALDRADEFRVSIWLEFADHDNETLASQAEWDSLVLSSTGIHQVLNETQSLASGGLVRTPSALSTDLVDVGEETLCHFTTFTITIE